ncbi:MAG: hypothetical protein V3V15_09285 [Sphingorhabdus sp.]
MRYYKAALTSCVLAVAAITAVPANACTTIDHMSTVTIFHDVEQKAVPEGMVQLKVRVSAKQQGKPGSNAGYVIAHVVDGEPGRRRLAILTPLLTSCDQLDVPLEGEYYLTGVFAKGLEGRKLYLSGGAIFAARIERSRVVLIPEAAPTESENAS